MAGKKKQGTPNKERLKTLDLHGRTVDEVYDLVDRYLLNEAERGVHATRIMTGKGKGLVQKTVIDYLRQAGYPWHYETNADGRPNEGVLIVRM